MSKKPDLKELALAIATDAHKHQVRKYTGEPYIEHPKRVARLVSIFLPDDENTYIAALLHDVVEDSAVTVEEIKELFGEDVAKLVDSITKSYVIKSREIRNKHYNKQLEASDQRAQTIKAADIMDNMDNFIVAMVEHKSEKYSMDGYIRYANMYINEKLETVTIMTKLSHRVYNLCLNSVMQQSRLLSLIQTQIQNQNEET